ncbi:MAG: RNA-binding protein [Candidatus Methanomethylophilaceae archaeon]|jgi:exosome complex component RRP4|nr:RNA-binding protein [Thermoplasmata archaeon]MBO5654185.1 RNA-binding protein [Candidatus Methanomethylophilaceae archaeon]MBR1973151.1 RNA-binding protein [Candidatus Methanomethylophilaceae archaeon]MBR7124437.1 RNA-binding protein [Candidatus Methanomethylophilaceae archaeon]
MERRNAKPKRELVLPGDVIDESGAKAGEYAYSREGKVYAAVMGIKNVSPIGVSVIPLWGQYMPSAGDFVIGVVNDIGPSNWMIDINAPYPAPLHVSEVPWKVEFGDTSRFLNIGNVVFLKILSVDESKKIQVTMNDSGLRKVEGGLLVEIAHSKVSRVIGKSGSMIQLLKAASGCRIFVGQNGRIWIDGEEDRAAVVADAIKMIEEKAQARDLTEKVKVYLESKLPAEEE